MFLETVLYVNMILNGLGELGRRYGFSEVH